MRKDIIEARFATGLTQIGLAQIVGTTQGSISRIENGAMPVGRHLAPKIAKALGLPVLQVLYGSEKPSGRHAV